MLTWYGPLDDGSRTHSYNAIIQSPQLRSAGFQDKEGSCTASSRQRVGYPLLVIKILHAHHRCVSSIASLSHLQECVYYQLWRAITILLLRELMHDVRRRNARTCGRPMTGVIQTGDQQRKYVTRKPKISGRRLAAGILACCRSNTFTKARGAC